MPYTILFINTARQQTTFSLAWNGGASPGTPPVDRSEALVPLTIEDANLPAVGTSVWAVANWTDWAGIGQSRTSTAFPLAAQGGPGSTMLCTFYEPKPEFLVQALPIMAPVMSEGMVAREPTTGAIYVMLDGVMRHIPNMDVMTRLYGTWQGWTPVQTIMGYPTGTPISLDSYLLKGDGSPNIHLWVDGARRWIVSTDVFRRFNFNAQNVQVLPQAQVDAMPEGPVIV
jgi:hypothetical protein